MLFTDFSSERAVNVLSKVGFRIIKQGKHIGMSDGTHRVTIPRHKRLNPALFGPCEAKGVFGVGYGIVGTQDGIDFLKSWIEKVRSPLSETYDTTLWVPFPGFEAAFCVPFPATPVIEKAGCEFLSHWLHYRKKEGRYAQ